MPVARSRRMPARRRINFGRPKYCCATPVNTSARRPCLCPAAAGRQHEGELFPGAEYTSAQLQSRLLRVGHAFGQTPPSSSTTENYFWAPKITLRDSSRDFCALAMPLASRRRTPARGGTFRAPKIILRVRLCTLGRFALSNGAKTWQNECFWSLGLFRRRETIVEKVFWLVGLFRRRENTLNECDPPSFVQVSAHSLVQLRVR